MEQDFQLGFNAIQKESEREREGERKIWYLWSLSLSLLLFLGIFASLALKQPRLARKQTVDWFDLRMLAPLARA